MYQKQLILKRFYSKLQKLSNFISASDLEKLENISFSIRDRGGGAVS